MYKATVDPKRVLPWHHESTSQELIEIAKEGGLEDLPILAIEMPEEQRDLGDYVVYDGHNRREAAKRAKVELHLLVLQEPVDFRHDSVYNFPQYYNMSRRKFEEKCSRSINRAIGRHKDGLILAELRKKREAEANQNYNR